VKHLYLAVALLTALPARAAPPLPVDPLVSQLETSSKSVTTLAGEFTQRNRVKLFKQELKSKGRLVFRAPRQIRWEYTDPDPSTLILDGQKATLSTPGAPPKVFDLEHDATMRAIFDQLLLWLGPGSLAHARDDYELASGGSAEAPVLTLVPKPASPIAKAFQKIELRLDGKSWLLRSILLVEKSGDEKEIVFTRLEKNAKLPPDAFRGP
jgi:outer membrane lipoprotein carrier protein